MSARDLLIDAADYMAEHGHCKNRVRDEEGRVCAVGAMEAVMGEDMSFTNAMDALNAYVRREFGIQDPYGTDFDAVEWNNQEDVTGEDVILAMKNAASEM